MKTDMGVDQDYKMAFEYYNKAAEQNVANALNNIGFLYEKGLGVEKNYKLALEYYAKASNQKLSSVHADQINY